MAATTTRRTTASKPTESTTVEAEKPAAASADAASTKKTTEGVGSSDRYVVPFIHLGVPDTWVHFGSTRRQASADRYVIPLVHVPLRANWVDYGIWTAVGVALAGEVVSLPLVGAVGAGIVVLRHRARQGTEHP